MSAIVKDLQYYKFSFYGFFKNLRFFEPFLILFFLDKGLSYLQIGTLYAIREIAVNVLEIPTGVLADAIGRRLTMVSSFLSYILSFILFYLFADYWIFAAAMLLFSFGDAFRTGTHKAMIFEYLRQNNRMEQKGNYYGHTRSWSQFGSAISSIIAAAIVVFTGNYNKVFLFSLIPYLLDLGLMLTYPAGLDGEIKTKGLKSIKDKFTEVYNGFKTSFKHKDTWVTMANLSAYQGFFKASKDYLQPIVVMAVSALALFNNLNEEKSSAIIIGLVYFVIYLIASVTSKNSDKLVERFKSPELIINATLIAGALLGIASGALVKTEQSIVAVVLFIGFFIIQNLRKPIGTGVLADRVKSNILATGLSIQSQLDSLFAALFAVFVGFIADKFSVGAALFCMGLIILVLALLLRLKKQ